MSDVKHPESHDAKNQFLSAEHAVSEDIQKEWDQGNQQWWDWYMSLAENAPDPQATPLSELPAPPVHAFPDEADLDQELSESYELKAAQVDAFQRDGFIKLKQVLSPGALSLLREEMKQIFASQGEQMGSRFGSLEMMWTENPTVKKFVFSERLAELAAKLLGVAKVRLYHDNGLSKQPGCGRTPWHYDAHHFPIATRDVCTVWIPLQEIPASMGPLGFATGLDLVDMIADIPFSKFDTSYDQRIMERFRERNVQVDSSPFDLGEVSFHHNFNFHTAGPNRTTTSRMVLATTYFVDGAKVIDAPHMVNGDWQRFMPGVKPGQTIDTPCNPILYPRTSDQ